MTGFYLSEVSYYLLPTVQMNLTNLQNHQSIEKTGQRRLKIRHTIPVPK
jgi:hypothetical protein